MRLINNSKKVNKKDIGKLLSQWSEEFVVFVPSKENGVAMMAKWDGTDTSFVDWYRNTVIPPKAHFLPPMEEMFRFQKDKGSYQLEQPASDGQKQLIFAIRPCDEWNIPPQVFHFQRLVQHLRLNHAFD